MQLVQAHVIHASLPQQNVQAALTLFILMKRHMNVSLVLPIAKNVLQTDAKSVKMDSFWMVQLARLVQLLLLDVSHALQKNVINVIKIGS